MFLHFFRRSRYHNFESGEAFLPPASKHSLCSVCWSLEPSLCQLQEHSLYPTPLRSLCQLQEHSLYPTPLHSLCQLQEHSLYPTPLHSLCQLQEHSLYPTPLRSLCRLHGHSLYPTPPPLPSVDCTDTPCIPPPSAPSVDCMDTPCIPPPPLPSVDCTDTPCIPPPSAPSVDCTDILYPTPLRSFLYQSLNTSHVTLQSPTLFLCTTLPRCRTMAILSRSPSPFPNPFPPLAAVANISSDEDYLQLSERVRKMRRCRPSFQKHYKCWSRSINSFPPSRPTSSPPPPSRQTSSPPPPPLCPTSSPLHHSQQAPPPHSASITPNQLPPLYHTPQPIS